MKTIPSNETRFTPGNKRNCISYQFVTEDGNTPSSCTIHLGDTDPATGEKITDIAFFQQYHRMVDSEVHRNLKCARRPCTKEEEAWRREETARYREEFEQDHGYPPTKDDIQFHLQQLEKNRYTLSCDSLINEDGESVTDYMPDFGRNDEDPFGTDLPDDVYALREFAKTLTGRKKAVYEAMLTNLCNDARRITNAQLAREWGVRENVIYQDQQQIKRRIRKLYPAGCSSCKDKPWGV